MRKIFLILILILAPLSSSRAEVVDINSANFPDDNFRAYISDKLDINADNILSGDEIERTVSMDVNGLEISSLAGIEYFTKLEELYCYSNKLASLDVSKNINLYALECDNNKLEDLDLSKNLKLIVLECELNSILILDLSANENLSYVKTYGQEREGLKVVSTDNKFRVDISPYVGLANLQRVVSGDITGYNASDDVIYPVSYDDNSGLAYFDEYPYSVTYQYLTGYYEYNTPQTMDVTLISSGDININKKTSQGTEKKSGGGSGGGGCNVAGRSGHAMRGLMFAVLLLALARLILIRPRNRLVKSQH